MKKKVEPPENLERWMVSYADFMTLLFALFVVLYAFAMAKQSDAKNMIESIAQAFAENTLAPPGGVLLVAGSLSDALSQEVQAAIESQISSSSSSKKQIIDNGGSFLNFTSAANPSDTEIIDETESEDSDATNTRIQTIIRQQEIVAKQGQGGFQAGGDADEENSGGQSQAQQSGGEGKDGAHFDSIRRSLSEAISDSGMSDGISIEEDPHWLSININSGVIFAEGSASILAPSKPIIRKVAQVISNINNYVRVRGYTDNSFEPNGIFKNSWDLSAQRSVSVIEELQRDGIDPERMAIEAFGEFSPTYSNDTAAGRALNRKVVIAISRYAMENNNPKFVSDDEASGQAVQINLGGSAGNDVNVIRRDNQIEFNFSRE